MNKFKRTLLSLGTGAAITLLPPVFVNAGIWENPRTHTLEPMPANAKQIIKENTINQTPVTPQYPVEEPIPIVSPMQSKPIKAASPKRTATRITCRNKAVNTYIINGIENKIKECNSEENSGTLTTRFKKLLKGKNTENMFFTIDNNSTQYPFITKNGINPLLLKKDGVKTVYNIETKEPALHVVRVDEPNQPHPQQETQYTEAVKTPKAKKTQKQAMHKGNNKLITVVNQTPIIYTVDKNETSDFGRSYNPTTRKYEEVLLGAQEFPGGLESLLVTAIKGLEDNRHNLGSYVVATEKSQKYNAPLIGAYVATNQNAINWNKVLVLTNPKEDVKQPKEKLIEFAHALGYMEADAQSFKKLITFRQNGMFKVGNSREYLELNEFPTATQYFDGSLSFISLPLANAVNIAITDGTFMYENKRLGEITKNDLMNIANTSNTGNAFSLAYSAGVLAKGKIKKIILNGGMK